MKGRMATVGAAIIVGCATDEGARRLVQMREPAMVKPKARVIPATNSRCRLCLNAQLFSGASRLPPRRCDLSSNGDSALPAVGPLATTKCRRRFGGEIGAGTTG